MANISSSVQFYGIEPVMRAYVSRGVPSWAIWHNKQFMFKCETSDINEGETQLRNTLDMIAGSVATYTLCVHEKLQGGRITSKSEHDGSFNFQLNSRDLAAGNGIGGDIKQLLLDIRKSQLEQELRLDQLEGENQEDEVGGIVAGIKQVMEIPGVPDIVAGLISKIVNKQPPGIAGVPGVEGNGISTMESERVMASYTAIKQGMPTILELMERLAEMSIHDRARFDNLKNMLSTFVQ